ncbi:DUF397 domain-containing protein, partial [Streptomyces europaeiscabiei]|nr:DUF397 domain-containing protein [Streptomyces europaeiscabiei]
MGLVRVRQRRHRAHHPLCPRTVKGTDVPDALRRQTSSFSGADAGDTCVELVPTSSAIHIRESDTPTTHLTTT